MILSLRKKEQIVDKIRKKVEQSVSVVVASLEGISVNAVTKLRKEARNIGVYVRVVPNTLMRRVIHSTSIECLSDVLVGQSVIGFSTNKPSDSARIFVQFNKEHDNFKIKGAAFEGKFISACQISYLSDLLSHTEAIARLMLVIKVGSIGNLMYLLHALLNRDISQ